MVALVQLVVACAQNNVASPHEDPGKPPAMPSKFGSTKQAGVSSQTKPPPTFSPRRTSKNEMSLAQPESSSGASWKRIALPQSSPWCASIRRGVWLIAEPPPGMSGQLAAPSITVTPAVVEINVPLIAAASSSA